MTRLSCFKVRSSALAIIGVQMANPNGDPDEDGRPRQMSDGCGWLTDVCVKRKVRDLLDNHDSPVFKHLIELLKLEDPEQFYVFESLNRGSGAASQEDANKYAFDLIKSDKDAFLQRYVDARLFGIMAMEPKNDKGKVADDDKGRMKRTGPITMSSAVSVAPIEVVEASLTKMASLRDSVAEKESTDMAPLAKKYVRNAYYVMRISVNPNVAEHTQTTEKDIEVFKGLLKFAFSASESATRPAGGVFFKHIWWADHTNPLGSFNEQEFFEKLTPVKRQKPNESSNNFDEYEVPTPNFSFKVEDLA